MTVDDGAMSNPLAGGPLVSRSDVQRAVRDLYEPLAPFTSGGGARVRLGSSGAAFAPRVADLEGFARPLYGIVPLVVGGGSFDGWAQICEGLDAGTDPSSPEYWGPIRSDVDQRMVEQAAIGLALAFCPDQVWEPLGASTRDRLVSWLGGIFEFEPAPNNWQFFRILVGLGLERVGVGAPAEPIERSHRLIESYRRGTHSYVDGDLGNVDYYLPFALHTYGLFYAAANDLGLGEDARAEGFRERAAGFAPDFRNWFAPDGATIALGRSLTYRFAMTSFWGALAWADVSSTVPWGEGRGHTLRHLRWWADKSISDGGGTLTVGFTYANRLLAESYNSPGSPYWCMKAFAGLGAGADHPFWAEPEEAQPGLAGPVTLPDQGWVVARDDNQATALVAQRAWAFEFPEQAGAKYRKFAYSSAFGFSADVADLMGGRLTDSTLAFTDGEGNRRARLGVEAAGVADGLAWSSWFPWADVRVDTVCWSVDGAWHGRLHQVTTQRPVVSTETGFSLGYDPDDDAGALRDAAEPHEDHARFTTGRGTVAVVGLAEHGRSRTGLVSPLAVNANLVAPHAAVPSLSLLLDPGSHRLACAVQADPVGGEPGPTPPMPPAVLALLERVAAERLSAR